MQRGKNSKKVEEDLSKADTRSSNKNIAKKE
jgi:hypothetical protein